MINLHLDEFNEIVGKEFIPMVNKAGDDPLLPKDMNAIAAWTHGRYRAAA